MSKHNRDRRHIRIPPPNRLPTELAGKAFFGIESYNVGSWCPTPDGSGPATQVHVQIKLKGVDTPLAMRFKTARAVDEFIACLERHRSDVWPHEPPAAE